MPDSAFSPERMAECNLPFIPAIEGDLVADCDLCVTVPAPLFNPAIPLPPPPSFDFGCYPMISPSYKKLGPFEPDDDGVIIKSTFSARISYPDFVNTGYCKPQIRIKFRRSSYETKMWNACDQTKWPFNWEPAEGVNKNKLAICCGPTDDCLSVWSTTRYGFIEQYSNPPCEYVKLVIADKTALVSDINIANPNAFTADSMAAFGYAEVAFSPCNIAFSFVCDVYCDETTLVVAFRRLYFQKGILVGIDPYDENSGFEQDTLYANCPGQAVADC